jgi:hypothetical protein
LTGDFVGFDDGGTRPLDLLRPDHPSHLGNRDPVGGGELVEAAVLDGGGVGGRVGAWHRREVWRVPIGG